MRDDLGYASYAAALAKSLERCFAPWSRMCPEEWAEEVYRLPDGRRFKWSYCPYAREMYRSMFDRRVIETVFQVYSRGLKSTVVLLALGYFIDQSPRRMLSLWPTNSQAEKWSKDILTGELLATTPRLQFLSNKEGRRVSSNTLLHKNFPGGLIDIFGANAPGDMRRAKGSFLYSDEIDAIETTISDEGDQLAIFDKRGDEYPDTIRVTASYPSVKGSSRINAKLERTDWNQWESTCLLCGGEPFVMSRRHLVYPKDDPAGARLQCPRCREYLTDVHRYEMAHGQGHDNWRPTRDFRGRKGFQANAMLWPHPVDPIKYPGGFLQLVAERELADESSENPKRSKRVTVNTVDAEPWDPTDETEKPPEWHVLYERREGYADEDRVTVPSGGLVITAMVDCHLNRLEVNWCAHGRKQEAWNLIHTVLYGNIRAQEVWDDLAGELARKFKHESGASMVLTIALIDGGWASDEVFGFLQRLARNPVEGVTGKVRASKGVGRHGHPVIDPKYRSIAKQLKGHNIGTWGAKDAIYQRLRMKINEDGSFPDGYIHFSRAYSEEFLRQAVSESVTIVFDKGEEIRKYVNPSGNRNEALDLLVGNLAAFRLHPRNLDAIESQLLESVKPQEPEERGLDRPIQESRLCRGGGFSL